MTAHPQYENDRKATLGQLGRIKSKPFLRRIHDEWHQAMCEQLPDGARRVVEIGSGTGYLHEALPEVVATDILTLPWLTVAADALHMPFRASSLDAVVMINVMHHLPDLEAFFNQIRETLRPGGRLVCVEPWVNAAAGFVWTWLHHEPYAPASPVWTLPHGGPLAMANSALPWIALERDRSLFQSRFPELSIVSIEPQMPFAYILSGGLKTPLGPPEMVYRPLRRLEDSPLVRAICPGMFALIVIEKRLVG